MTPFEAGRFALLWGPGILVLVVFTYGFSRLALHWIDKSMEVKRRQMESSFDVARTYLQQFVSAQKSQADAFSRLASTVERRDSQESFEHQEMLIAIKAMREQLSTINVQLIGEG
jgi:hypothetical protein